MAKSNAKGIRFKGDSKEKKSKKYEEKLVISQAPYLCDKCKKWIDKRVYHFYIVKGIYFKRLHIDCRER